MKENVLNCKFKDRQNRIVFYMAFLFLGMVVASCQNSAKNELTTAEQEEGWKLLFDGSTLNGWRDFQGKEVTGPWKVEAGLLNGLGQGSDSTGYLVSESQYENFVLTFDWKISKGGNSGVFYHVIESPEFKLPYATGPEYQVIDDIDFPRDLKEWQRVGANYAMHNAVKSKGTVKKAGMWNTSKIVFDNGHVEHWLNGEKIVEFKAWTEDWFTRKTEGKNAGFPEYGLARHGHFSLQDHGSPVWYKNIKLKELPRQPKEEALFNGENLDGWVIYGKELWYVKDNELVCESGPEMKYGYFGTEKYYDDFDLSLEFNQERDGNSGVFIRSTRNNGQLGKPNWQVEVAPPGEHTAGVFENPRGWLVIPDEPKDSLLKMGEWNKMRIRAVGDSLTTWLNGVQMIELVDESFGQGQGRILLQIHDGRNIKVRWRNIYIKELNN